MMRFLSICKLVSCFVLWLPIVFACSEQEEAVVEEQAPEETGPVVPVYLDTTIQLGQVNETLHLRKIEMDTFLIPFRIYLPDSTETTYLDYIAPVKKSKEITIGDRIVFTYPGGTLEFGDLDQALDADEARDLIKRLYPPQNELRKFPPDIEYGIYKVRGQNADGSELVVHLARKAGKQFYIKEVLSRANYERQRAFNQLVLTSINWSKD